MIVTTRRKVGEPVIVIGALLGCWILARSLLWQSPFGEFPDVTIELAPLGSNGRAEPTPSDELQPPGEKDQKFEIVVASIAQVISKDGKASPHASTASRVSVGQTRSASPRSITLRPPFAVVRGPVPVRSPSLRTENEQMRWSLDSWLFYRPNSQLRASPGQLLPTYGASQAGAVLRFQLAPESAQRPFAYMRASVALSGPEQADIAAGLGLRPLADIPVKAMAELRVSMNDGRNEIRPAGLAVTELAPINLPLGARAEIYAQAGYVGGDFATAFADGHAQIDREVGDFDLASVRLGTGVWGGVQKGAARLDVGPTASVQIHVANRPVRIAFDYRRRIAGDARPPSGIALTLSTGF